MEENDGSSSRAPVRHTIALPPRTSMESLFTGGPGASPGPMTLVSNFFSDNDPDSECRSFSQLLAGAMASPAAVPAVRRSFQQPENSSSREKDSGGDGDGDGGDAEFRFKQNWPTGLVVSQSAMFTVPPGLSPASLLDSPGFFSPGQGAFGLSHQQVLAQVTAQAAQAQTQMQMPAEYPSLSSAPAPPSSQLQSRTLSTTAHQQMPPPVPDPNIMKESADVSHPDQRLQPPITVDKPADDGYNWRKYGQKQVKGSEYPRSYYKCTHPNCPVKKKVERSHDGQVTEIIYKGQHNHQPPQPIKRAKDSKNPNGTFNLQGNSELGSMGGTENLNISKEGFHSHSLVLRDQESSQATPEQVSGSSDGEEVGDAETGVAGRDDDEPESKRRNIEARTSEPASSHKTVSEPRIIVQTTSEVDLLDDGYRWRKYGQKVVKGNPYPRSYYKCTSQGCNVRKHVERAASDPKAVITTYEGKHNHDVPAAKNSSHSTVSMASQLKPHTALVDNQSTSQRAEFKNNGQQPMSSLRFKEEQIA